MEAAADEVRKAGTHAHIVIPLGASTPLGAAAFALAIAELLEQIPPPDVIIHASSSGGTQAGLVAGCALAGVRDARRRHQRRRAGRRAAVDHRRASSTGLGGARRRRHCERFDGRRSRWTIAFVGGGYGVPTPESREAAIELAARSEALFLDPTYTAKAMAGLIAYVRGGAFRDADTVLFWHTGGQVGLFA